MALHGTLAVVIAFSLTSLSTIVVGLRFYCRYVLVRKLSSSDWMMVAALLSTWGSAVVNYYQVHFMDFSKVNSKETFAAVVVGSLRSWWIYRLFYITDLCLIKISILLFYNYVASVHKSFHRIVKALMIIVLTSSVGMLIAGIFSCNPPSDAWSFEVFWDGFKGIYAKQCYNPTILWFFGASFNLVTDCVIWILPIPFVLNLQSMYLRRRLELAGIFSIGIMAVAASAIRLWVLTEWASDFEKQGAETGNLLIWGQVEQHAGIIAASVPFLRPIVIKAFRPSSRRDLPSAVGPVAKLIPAVPLGPDGMPIPPRTPIIPSPPPTFGTGSGSARRAPSPLSPIAPIAETHDTIGSAV